MNYSDWEQSVPTAIREDALWNMEAYRLALFLADIAWHDTLKLTKNRSTKSLADQLYRSVGSISANLAEGYSKNSSKDRARFYEYALGSARESRGWFYKGRHIISETVSNHRIELSTQIIRLLLKMVPDQRSYVVKEEQHNYTTEIPILAQEAPF